MIYLLYMCVLIIYLLYDILIYFTYCRLLSLSSNKSEYLTILILAHNEKKADYENIPSVWTVDITALSVPVSDLL